MRLTKDDRAVLRKLRKLTGSRSNAEVIRLAIRALLASKGGRW
jgi:hypothetical protein